MNVECIPEDSSVR